MRLIHFNLVSFSTSHKELKMFGMASSGKQGAVWHGGFRVNGQRKQCGEKPAGFCRGKLALSCFFYFSSIASASCTLPVFQNGRLSIPAVQVVLPAGDMDIYSANLDYSSSSAHFSIASAEPANPVDLIVTTVPSPLRVGEHGHIQVQLIPNVSIDVAALEVVSASDALEITPVRMPLGNLSPPTSGSASATSPPDPPALGVVPIVNFQVKVLRPGTYAATVVFQADCGAVKRRIVIKGE